MTPGVYLRNRRQAAGLSIEELSLRLDSVPHVSARSRGEWLLDMEGDRLPIGVTTAIALYRVQELAIDLELLANLIDAVAERPIRMIAVGPQAQVSA